MNNSNEKMEIVDGVRGIKGCEYFTEEECVEAWEESIAIGMIEE